MEISWPVDELKKCAGRLAFLLDLQGVLFEEVTSILEVVSCVLARYWQLSLLGWMKFARFLLGIK